MTAEPSISEPAEPPRAVKWIGWIWLILAVLFLFRSLLDIAVWSVLRPVASSIFSEAERQSPELAFFRPLFEHLTVIKVVESIASILVAFTAVQFLRLRPWARIAMQTVGWLVLGYLVCFGALWAEVWVRTVALHSATPSSSRTASLIAGLAVCALLVSGLLAMIALLRRAHVRETFRSREL
jgi:hypothetical protein